MRQMSLVRIHRTFHFIGSPFHHQACIAFEIVSLFFQVIRRIPNFATWRLQEIFHFTVQIGVGSLPVITASTVFSGLVVSHEIAWHMDQALHTVSMIPGFTAQFILRELAIAVSSLLLVSKVGASITAEIGSMKVTEQIDALILLKIDPVQYLVFPRFIASIISSICLTLIASSVTLFFAILFAIAKYNFSFLEYLNQLRHFVAISDVFCALVKGAVYGAVIPIISCAYGFRCRGGAEGVGNATTQSVVASTVTIISLDFLLTYIFTFFL